MTNKQTNNEQKKYCVSKTLTRLHRKVPDLLLLHGLLLLLLLLLILDGDHLLLLHLGLLLLLHLLLNWPLHLHLRDDPLALELELATADVDRGGREHGAAAATATVAIAVAVVVGVLAMAPGRPVGGEAAGPAAAGLVVAVGSAAEAGRQPAAAERTAAGAALHAAAAGAGSPALLVAIEKERHCGGGKWMGWGVEDQFNSRSVGILFQILDWAQTPLADRRFVALLLCCRAVTISPVQPTSSSMPAIQSAARFVLR